MADEKRDFLAYNLEFAAKEHKTQEIQQFISELLEYITLQYKKKNLVALQKNINLQKKKISFLVRKEVASNNVDFAIGRYAGIIETYENIVVDAIKKENIINEINESRIEEIPHIHDVISNIAQNPGIRHGKLAEKVGIEKNTLTSITDKLVEIDLITFSRPGKFKYYYLTSSGENFYKVNLKQLRASVEIDYLIEQMLLTLSQSDKPSELVATVMKALYDGEYKYNGYKSKKSESIDPWKLFPDIISKCSINVLLPNMTNSFFADTATLISFSEELTKEKYILFSNSHLSANEALLYEEV